MLAAQITEYGGQDSLRVTDDAARPVARKGQVLVEVYAAGVNPFDITVREGRARQMAELDFPATLGGDFAGVVSDVGEGVEGFREGEEVYGQASPLSGQGSFAQYAPVKATQLAAKPRTVDFDAAATLPLPAVSAYQALVDHMDLRKGQKILVHGGAGGIGSVAVQLAKHLGAYVAATAKGSDKDFVMGLGADEVIDYETQDFAELTNDYDAVLDTVGGETNAKSYAVLRPGGKLVSMTAQPDETLADKYKIGYIAQFTRVTPDRLKAISKLVDDGELKPQIDKVFPLDHAAEAVEYLKTGHPKGKVVIRIKR